MDIKGKTLSFLAYFQRYTKTDMLYATRGGSWMLAEKAGTLIVSLISMAAFANWVTPESFGVYQFVISGATLAGLFALPGLNTAMIRSIARGKEGTLKLVLAEKFKWSLIGSAGLLLLVGWYHMQGNTTLASAFLIAAVFLPFYRAFLSFHQFWNGRKRFDLQSKYSIAAAILPLFILLPALYFTDSIVWILLAYFSSQVLFNGLFLFKTLRQVVNEEQDRDIIPFGKNLTIMGALETVGNHIDKIILWHFLGPLQVAIYSFARLPIKTAGGILPLRALALPKLGEKNVRDIKHGILDKFYRLFVLSIPTSILLILIAPLVYGIIFPQYLDSVIYFQAMTVLIAIIPFTLLEFALVADQRNKELYSIKIIPPVVRIALFIALVPFFGIWGMVSALIITALLKGGLTLYHFQRI